MVITTPLMTADELLWLPDDGMQHELIDGVLLTMPPDNFNHGNQMNRLGRVLGNYVDAHDLGVVVNNTGFTLRQDPDTVLGPDVAFVAKERVPDDQTGFVRLAPDLAIEIRSPSNTLRELDRKTAIYLETGTRLVWVVDSVAETVAVHMPGQSVLVLTIRDTLTGEPVLPGFSLSVAEIFR